MKFQEEIEAALQWVRKNPKKAGRNIVHSEDLPKWDRELLVQARWLEPITKGWYILLKSNAKPCELSYWHANFWDFIGAYLRFRYNKNYCLSAENSIDLHTKTTTIPKEVIVIARKGGGKPLDLPFGTSLAPCKELKNFPEEKVEMNGLQIMDLGYALCKLNILYFEEHPERVKTALRMITSPDQLLGPIIEYDLRKAAARLMGAYLSFDDYAMAESLECGLQENRIKVKPENPF